MKKPCLFCDRKKFKYNLKKANVKYIKEEKNVFKIPLQSEFYVNTEFVPDLEGQSKMNLLQPTSYLFLFYF